MSDDRLIDLKLDQASLSAASANVEHERRIAIFDLLENNSFAVEGKDEGPYALALGLEEGRLIFNVTTGDGGAVAAQHISLAPLRKLIKDYFLICDSYYAAIRDASPMQIEAIDMGRRGLHNEAAEVLTRILEGKFRLDHETARRLFTLVCALQHVRS